jgi:hypothetical protein
MTANVQKGAEEGNVISMRHKAYAPNTCTRDRRMWNLGDASFARSFDPCTSILTMHQRRKSMVVGRASRHHGWANSGNREEPTLGSARTDEARLATPHRFSNEEGVRCSRKGRRSRSPSLRGSRAETWFGCPHVEVQLQKSVGDNWSRISSAYALQKEWSGSSERGPSSERGSAGDTVGKRVERKEVARRTHR